MLGMRHQRTSVIFYPPHRVLDAPHNRNGFEVRLQLGFGVREEDAELRLPVHTDDTNDLAVHDGDVGSQRILERLAVELDDVAGSRRAPAYRLIFSTD
jgi:hypothetical protein